jgi:ATP-binding cassette, subfamily A (ABC1), member 3
MEKKVLHSWRNWLLLLIQTIIPITFITITIVIVRSWGGNQNLPDLNLSVRTYDPTVTTVEFNTSNWVDSIESKIFEGYREQFRDLARDRHELNVINSSMIPYYLKLSKTILSRLNNRYLFGVTIESPNITVWYNNQPYHTSPISLNLLHNAVLRAVSGGNVSISVSNKPLPFRSESRMMMLQAGNNLGFQLSFNIGFAMAFVSSFFIIVYIKERVTKAKLLQFVSGVNVVMYWITAFLWDYLLFVVIAFLMTATIGAFQEDGYSTFEQLGRIYFVLLMFGFAVLPFIYIAAFFFNAPASGFTKMSIIFIFLGVAMYTVVFSMKFEGFNLKHVANTLTWIFLTVPHFALSNAFSNMNMVNVLKDVCRRQCDLLGICGDKLCEVNARCCSE